MHPLPTLTVRPSGLAARQCVRFLSPLTKGGIMYLLDPTEGLSREELLQKIWRSDFTQPMRVKIIGHELDHTWLCEIAPG